MLVVRTAEQAHAVRSVNLRSREAVAVIEFQGASLAAPAAMLVGKRAAAAVALEDLIGRSINAVHLTVRSSQGDGSLARIAAHLPFDGSRIEPFASARG